MLLLSVNNFTWKRSEDMELFISVYMTGGSTAEQRAPRYPQILCIFVGASEKVY
jgi:hypothetical protein